MSLFLLLIDKYMHTTNLNELLTGFNNKCSSFLSSRHDDERKEFHFLTTTTRNNKKIYRWIKVFILGTFSNIFTQLSAAVNEMWHFDDYAVVLKF